MAVEARGDEADSGIRMSEADTAIPESEKVDQRELAKRFNVVVALVAFGALGIVLFWIYKRVESIRKAADEARGAFSLLTPPRHKSRRKTRHTRIAGRRWSDRFRVSSRQG